MGKRTRIAAGALAVLALVGTVALGFAGLTLYRSLPHYEGELRLSGLAAPVTVERDALGVVTIRSSHADDEARALGFVHAQERFFQMDLLRRSATGELAALVGPAAVELDLGRRAHGLREVAARAARESPPDYRARLAAYADGVNQGLAALGARPFEYWLLRAEPEPWAPVDSVLAIAAMYFDMHDDVAAHERSERVAREVLPAPVADLLFPRRTLWDAPLTGSPGPPASIPSASVYDLRRVSPAQLGTADRVPSERADTQPGSNNWALGGTRTADGRGLLASDMHMSLRVPSTWFRASLERAGRRVTGLSLPGVPMIAAGSNGDVAWSFTNSYGDWVDLVALELDPANPSRYLGPAGWLELETVSETIEVAGAEPLEISIERTMHGPVVGRLPSGAPFAVRWVAHDTRAYSPAFMDLVDARNVSEAIEIAKRSGILEMNFVAADAEGNIGWTIAGPIPDRDALAGPNAAGFGGWLTPEDHPAVVNPPDAQIWTANGRVADGEMLEKIGDGGYALGARATQIRDRLRSLDGDASIDDMLAMQLDDEARLMSRWRDALLATLDGATTTPLVAAAGEAVLAWDGRAAVHSVGYRLVRGWRLVLIARMLEGLTAEIRALDPDWRYVSFREEHWAWALLEQEPLHLLDPRFSSWQALKLDALDELLTELLGVDSPTELAARTWGNYNVVHVRHPLSAAVAGLSRWLDMPPAPLPGDTLVPRVQTPGFGASARFALSPGDEANGYLHMPGGQSGHPLSPYFGAGHDAWVDGRKTPFLPGAAERTLRLRP